MASLDVVGGCDGSGGETRTERGSGTISGEQQQWQRRKMLWKEKKKTKMRGKKNKSCPGPWSVPVAADMAFGHLVPGSSVTIGILREDGNCGGITWPEAGKHGVLVGANGLHWQGRQGTGHREASGSPPRHPLEAHPLEWVNPG
ncbi:hypothetical protein B0T13DRAFT_518269 [Neurospora crassa]|nr:hypothetical protein B0T13DRAFT_528046 [Neurospora crassa]KAK3493488.1 hypothetical protein B0T13DRAFT_518269 [Neurospora crassa]